MTTWGDAASKSLFESNPFGLGIFNVGKRGARGNGTANDATAIQDTIADADAVGGGILFFPPGTYKLEQQLLLKSNLILCGLPGLSKLQFSGSMAAANLFSGTSLSQLVIRDLELIGDTSENAASAAYGGGVMLNSCVDVVLWNLYIHGFVQKGINIVGASTYASLRGKIKRCRIDSISSIGTTYVGGVHGITMSDGCQDWEVDDCKVTNIGTPANNTAGIGIIALQLDTGWATPDAIRVRRCKVSDACQHGIAYYASQLTVAEHHPDSVFEGNTVRHTGKAATVGAGGAANQLGNGIYCEQLIPGAITGNTTDDTHVAAVSTTIADAAIAVMVNTGSAILDAAISIAGNSSSNCNRAGLRVQRVASVSIAGHTATGCLTYGLQLDGVQEFSVQGTFKAGATVSATGVGADLGTGGLGTSPNGCQNGQLELSVEGFPSGAAFISSTNLRGRLVVDGYTTQGIIVQTSTECTFDLRASSTTVQAVTSSGVSTACRVRLDAPNRNTYTAPFVRNNGTGVIVETTADSAAPNQGTWAVGDMVRFTTPTAGAADYALCTTAGSPGTWKLGAAPVAAPVDLPAATGTDVLTTENTGDSGARLALTSDGHIKLGVIAGSLIDALVPLTGDSVGPGSSTAFYAYGGLRLTMVTDTLNHAVGPNECVVRMDATAGALTVTLPAPASAKSRHLVKIMKVDSSANAVTISVSGGSLISGAASITLAAQWNAVELFFDETQWVKFSSV